MSRIAKKIKEKKSQKDRDSWKEGKKTTVTARFDEFTIFCLDKIVDSVGGTRTSNAQEFVEESIHEGLVALGYNLETLKDEYFQKGGGGLFIDGVRVDNVDDFMSNPDKYGVTADQDTESENEDKEAK